MIPNIDIKFIHYLTANFNLLSTRKNRRWESVECKTEVKEMSSLKFIQGRERGKQFLNSCFEFWKFVYLLETSPSWTFSHMENRAWEDSSS